MQKNTLIILGLSIGFSSLTYSITPNDQLLKAAQEGDLQQAQEAVAAGADINHVYILTQSSTALHVAAFYGNKDIIKFLLDKDANVNIDNRMGFTPLHLAISLLPSKNAAYSQKNSVVIAKLLLAAGADINAKANMGDTPLHRAVTSNQVDVVQLLIKNGARTLKNYHGETALDKARENNQQDIIQILSELPTLKELSARTTRGLIGQRALTLEQLKNNIPQELYDFVVESFYNESLLEGKLSYELEDAITAHISSLA
jgi:ankyrin repeat protein